MSTQAQPAVRTLLLNELVKVLRLINEALENIQDMKVILQVVKDLEQIQKTIHLKILNAIQQFQKQKSSKPTKLWELLTQVNYLIKILTQYYSKTLLSSGYDDTTVKLYKENCKQELQRIKDLYFKDERPDPVLLLICDEG